MPESRPKQERAALAGHTLVCTVARHILKWVAAEGRTNLSGAIGGGKPGMAMLGGPMSAQDGTMELRLQADASICAYQARGGRGTQSIMAPCGTTPGFLFGERHVL